MNPEILGPFLQWGARGITPPKTNVLSANHQIFHVCRQRFLLFCTCGTQEEELGAAA